MEVLQKIQQAIFITGILEWVAVVTSVAYVVFMSYHKITAWYFAGISSFIYVYICYDAHLFLDALLQVFYVGMAVYGWYTWKTKEKAFKLKRSSLISNIVLIGIGLALSIFLGWIFSIFTIQANPFLDAFIFVFSIIATHQASKSVLENWLFWILIDASAIYIFSSRELYLTAILYFVYAVMAVFGFITWTRIYKNQVHD